MIKVLNKRPIDDDNSICIGTHNGKFHSDEIIAIALLAILTRKDGNLFVIRSRDLDFLEENVDLLVDIGGGEYDHHQKGGNGQRKNGIKYASAGLIWKDFGYKIISNLSNNKLSVKEIYNILDDIDKDIIQNVDMIDNGQHSSNHPFQFIRFFLPKWNQTINYDEKFEQCINVVYEILENIIESYISVSLGKNEIKLILNDPDKHIGNILVIPSQTLSWTYEVVDYNEHSNNKIDFVVFPYPTGGYALQCVPCSMNNTFSSRIPLPESWAGETSRLPEITGLKSAIFCHNERFFAHANEYSDILKMCRIATEKYYCEKKSLKK